MRVLKRVLTRKSILGYGYAEYRDLSVQMILDLEKLLPTIDEKKLFSLLSDSVYLKVNIKNSIM